MSPFSKLPCWAIMNCAEDKKCPAKENTHLDCWEVFSMLDRDLDNICRDCIVYITRQEDVLSENEMTQIMLKKGIIASPCGSFVLGSRR